MNTRLGARHRLSIEERDEIRRHELRGECGGGDCRKMTPLVGTNASRDFDGAISRAAPCRQITGCRGEGGEHFAELVNHGDERPVSRCIACESASHEHDQAPTEQLDVSGAFDFPGDRVGT